jgi:hypothetical protein
MQWDRRRRRRKRSSHKGRVKCISGKTLGFDTEEGAKVALRTIQEKKQREGRQMPIRVYECSYCGRWHHTSKRGGEVRYLAIIHDEDPPRPPVLHTPQGRFYREEVAATLLGLSLGQLRKQVRRGVISSQDGNVPAEEVDGRLKWQEQKQTRRATASKPRPTSLG